MNRWQRAAAWLFGAGQRELDDENVPEETSLPPEPTSETPPVEQIIISGARKVSRVYPADQITPRLYKAILREADNGFSWQLMELLDDVAADPDIGADIRSRKLAVAGAPYKLDPGEDSDLGRGIAEEATLFSQRIPNFVQMKMDLLDAWFRGFACVQPKWRASKSSNRFDLVDWMAIESRFFRFDYGDIPLVETESIPSGQRLPEGALFHVVRDRAGAIVRGGLGRTVGKYWLYGGYNLIDAVSFLERFGHPYLQVELGPNIKEGSPELARAKEAARRMMVDQVGFVPAGVQMKFLDSVNKAGNFKDMFLAFRQCLILSNSKAIRGHAATSNPGEGGLGHGGDTEQASKNEQAIIEYDAVGLDEMLTRQLYRAWTLYHYGPTAPVPRHHSLVEEPEDEQATANAKKTRADTIISLQKAGLKIKKSQVYEEQGLEEPETDEETMTAPAPPPSPFGGGQVGGEGEGDEKDPIASTARVRGGACPHCSGLFSFSEAEKKKRSLLAT